MSDKLKLFVENSATTLSGRLQGEVYKEFKHALGYQLEDAIWVQQYNPYSDGWKTTVCYSREHCKCSVKKDGTHFPTGLVSNACQFFRENGIEYEVVDIRPTFPTRSLDLGLAEDAIPHDYQQKAIEDAVERQRGLIKIATGGGKTFVGAGIIAALGVSPTIFYVTSVDLLRQAKAEIERFVRKSGKEITVGAVGGGYKKIGDITVMTVQTAIRSCGAKYQKFDDEDEDDSTDIEDIKKDIAELIRNAKLAICDEVQHWRAETCQVIADNSLSCRWRYGLSATPWRDAGDDILIDACFGRLICDINASYLIKRGFLVKPHIAFVPITNLKGQKYGSYPTTYKEGLVQNAYRNEWIAGLAGKLKDAGRTTLILVQQITHGESIQELIPGSVFLHGSSGKTNRKDHIELMRAGRAPITIASTIFDEGIDVRPLDSLILAGGGKSATRALQRIGRVIRNYTYPNGRKKSNALVYDLIDHLKYLWQHGGERRKIYMTEDQFEITDLDV